MGALMNPRTIDMIGATRALQRPRAAPLRAGRRLWIRFQAFTRSTSLVHSDNRGDSSLADGAFFLVGRKLVHRVPSDVVRSTRVLSVDERPFAGAHARAHPKSADPLHGSPRQTPAGVSGWRCAPSGEGPAAHAGAGWITVPATRAGSLRSERTQAVAPGRGATREGGAVRTEPLALRGIDKSTVTEAGDSTASRSAEPEKDPMVLV